MVHLRGYLHPLQLHERPDRGEDVIGLRPDGLGRRPGECGVYLQRLMVLLHFPPSLVDRGHPLVIEGQLAANQIQNAFRRWRVQLLELTGESMTN